MTSSNQSAMKAAITGTMRTKITIETTRAITNSIRIRNIITVTITITVKIKSQAQIKVQ